MGVAAVWAVGLGFLRSVEGRELAAVLLQRGIIQTHFRIYDVMTIERTIEARPRGVQPVFCPVQTVLQRREQVLVLGQELTVLERGETRLEDDVIFEIQDPLEIR